MKVLCGNALTLLRGVRENAVDCCVTSPPYFRTRDYQVPGQIGREETPESYVAALDGVFRQVFKVLKPSGVLWLVLGDTYANRIKGVKNKDLIGIPWRVALQLQTSGWYLRQDVIWNKLNVRPEPDWGRCTRSHEYIFMLTKSPKYYFNAEAIKEPNQIDPRSGWAAGIRKGKNVNKWKNNRVNPDRNDGAGIVLSREKSVAFSTQGRYRRSVWNLPTAKAPFLHFAVFPKELVRLCLLSGCPKGGVVLDPFMGTGTVGEVAKELEMRFLGIELNPSYAKMAASRLGANACK